MTENLLHFNKLEAFKEYLDSRDIPHRPGRGYYEVLQIKNNAGQWTCLFKRDKATEHYTHDWRMEGLIRNFIKDTRS